jgi:hypothetical protein
MQQVIDEIVLPLLSAIVAVAATTWFALWQL